MRIDADACYRAVKTRDARFDGHFFTGVTTTGVYCRPICPAPTPQRKNCRFFACAAAAQEAGFRPCLRCRPEISPGLPAFNGTSSTVSRALRLIAEGALAEGSIESLALRLGIGERHLRRLFDEYLGASPIAVESTRRFLLAKRLLTETTLPVTDISYAAGFSSVRRFNDVMKAAYGRTPRELRRKSGNARGSAINLTLPFRPPYNWTLSMRFLAPRAIPGVEQVTPEFYRRTLPSLVRSRSGQTPEPITWLRVWNSPRFANSGILSSGCAAFSTRTPLSPRSKLIWQRTRAWQRWSRRSRVCAFQAPGTASNSSCAPSSASRSR